MLTVVDGVEDFLGHTFRLEHHGVVVGATKLYYLSNGIAHPLVTDSPYFYIALTTMILGTQLFVAGFLGELISRNAPERNNYQIEKEL